MKLPMISRPFARNGLMSALALIGIFLTSCESMIYDGPGDCSVNYRLRFRYTKNILDADAFASQVDEINVALYDTDGRMVYRTTQQRALSTENDFTLSPDVAPGHYDIIAWCSGPAVSEEASSFILEGQAQGEPMTASGAYLQLTDSDEGYTYSRDIRRLYYGSLTNVEFADTYGTVDLPPVDLTRDTNHITIQLQNINGEPIDADLLSFTLEGSNSRLDWRNALTGDLGFTYRPWAVTPVYTSTGADDTDNRADDYVAAGVQAEFSTGRIMADREQRLTVTNRETGETILSIPMVEYLLLVRGNYQHATSAQDYLDRYDDFTMLFFVDDSYSWLKSRVYINNWRVVPPQNGGIEYED